MFPTWLVILIVIMSFATGFILEGWLHLTDQVEEWYKKHVKRN